MAVTDAAQVIALTRLAAAQGVRIGMRAASAQVMAPEILLQERDLKREAAALEEVALALLQFTPELTQASAATLLMDVTASLSAFGGRLRLCQRVRRSLHVLGYSVRMGMAPTAQAAWLFAHQRSHQHAFRRRVVTMARMKAQLDRLPWQTLPEAVRHADWLEGIGCQTLSDLRRLPRAGLKRRTNVALLDALDRAYGEAPELFQWMAAPSSFNAMLELPYRVEHAAQLLQAAHRLLLQLTGWLVAHQRAVTSLSLLLEHERGHTRSPPTVVLITLAEPAWQEAHLLRLLKERLERLVLPGPVILMRLEAMQFSDWAPPTAQLFPEPGGTPEDYRRLLELLAARLGPEAVRLPSARADHRPEAANQWQRALDGDTQDCREPVLPAAARPFWLLQTPLALPVRGHRPFYGSPLHLLSGPERIEAGWWDGALALRDYFVAQGEEGACYWVFRERDAGSARWFLHGLFA